MRADNDRDLFPTRLKTGVAARRLTTRWSGHHSAAAPHDSAKANCAFATSSGVSVNSRSLGASSIMLQNSYDRIAAEWHKNFRGQAYVDRTLSYVDRVLEGLPPQAEVL